MGKKKLQKRERRAFVKSSVPVNFQKTDRHFKLVCVCVREREREREREKERERGADIQTRHD